MELTMLTRMISLCALFGSISCASDGQTLAHVKADLIRSGYGEPNMAERYDLAIALPASEAQFVETINGIPLPIRRIDRPELARPYFDRDFDMSTISYGYTINGGYNTEKKRQELYTAYVNHANEIVYIENRYAYAVLP